MNQNMNAIIVLLIVTAGILGALLIASHSATPAYAGTIGMKQAEYVMGTINYSDKRDLVYVIDLNANKMVLYGIKAGAGQSNLSIQMVPDSTVDLAKAFKSNK